jgi:hypothetical protein
MMASFPTGTQPGDWDEWYVSGKQQLRLHLNLVDTWREVCEELVFGSFGLWLTPQGISAIQLDFSRV